MNPPLDSRQLRVFERVATTLNMRVAAEELGITVSGVSHCLKALERDLGCPLFDRSSGRLVLSAEGQTFAVEARQILEQMRAARGRMRSVNAWQPAALRLGADTTVCRHVLPAVIREFRESFPACQLSLQAVQAHEIAAALADQSLDLALTVEPEASPRLRFLPVGDDDLIFCTHALHPWALRRQVDREDLARRKLIVPRRTSPTFQLIQEYFRAEDLPLEPGLEVSDDDTAMELARLDLGIALLPRWLAAPDLAQRRLAGFPVGRRRLARRWGILHTAARAPSFAEQILANLSRSVLHQLVRTQDPDAEDCRTPARSEFAPSAPPAA